MYRRTPVRRNWKLRRLITGGCRWRRKLSTQRGSRFTRSPNRVRLYNAVSHQGDVPPNSSSANLENPPPNNQWLSLARKIFAQRGSRFTRSPNWSSAVHQHNGDKMLISGSFNFTLWDFNDENWKSGGLGAVLLHQIEQFNSSLKT